MHHVIRMLIILACTVTGLHAAPCWWNTDMPRQYKEFFQILEQYPYKNKTSLKTLKTPWFEEHLFPPIVGNIQQYLYQNRIDINYQNPVDGTTIAHWMARHEGRTYNTNLSWRLRLLHETRANFAITDRRGQNCLHHAVLGGIDENVIYLLYELDDPHALVYARDAEGFSPYDLALAYLGEDAFITQRLAEWMTENPEVQDDEEMHDVSRSSIVNESQMNRIWHLYE